MIQKDRRLFSFVGSYIKCKETLNTVPRIS